MNNMKRCVGGRCLLLERPQGLPLLVLRGHQPAAALLVDEVGDPGALEQEVPLLGGCGENFQSLVLKTRERRSFHSVIHSQPKSYKAGKENGSMVLRSNFVVNTNDFLCVTNNLLVDY